MDNLNLTETLTLTKWTDVRAASENTPFSGMSHGPPQKHLLWNPHKFRIQICGCTRRVMTPVRRCTAATSARVSSSKNYIHDPLSTPITFREVISIATSLTMYSTYFHLPISLSELAILNLIIPGHYNPNQNGPIGRLRLAIEYGKIHPRAAIG
jgi:hypothetical protein